MARIGEKEEGVWVCDYRGWTETMKDGERICKQKTGLNIVIIIHFPYVTAVQFFLKTVLVSVTKHFLFTDLPKTS